MLNIKLILLLPFLALIIAFVVRLRSKTFYRLAMIFVSALGVSFVLFPQITDRLAHLVGVGRGADLVTYLFIVFFFMAGIILYSKIRKIEADYTELVRKVSIQRAEKLN
jgi:hypothetical protein